MSQQYSAPSWPYSARCREKRTVLAAGPSVSQTQQGHEDTVGIWARKQGWLDFSISSIKPGGRDEWAGEHCHFKLATVLFSQMTYWMIYSIKYKANKWLLKTNSSKRSFFSHCFKLDLLDLIDSEFSISILLPKVAYLFILHSKSLKDMHNITVVSFHESISLLLLSYEIKT